MTEQYDSRLSSGRTLAASIGAADSSMNLSSVPPHLKPGNYRVRIDGEILTADYVGSGTLFSNLKRGLEGTTASAHRARVTVRHVITGGSLNALRSSAIAEAGEPDLFLYVRSAAVRAYLGANFT